MTIVVVGGGIVGLTAAYYLTKRGQKVTIVEKCAIACHSSGKAGGFLTDGNSGWHRGCIVPLAKHSFSLHEELARDFGADAIGYRRVKCVGRGGGLAPTPAWLKAEFKNDMGDQSGLAQVTPYKLMECLANAARANGCEVVIGKVVGVEIEGETVVAVNVDQQGNTIQLRLPCSSVIFGMGPWAREAATWFPESTLPRDTVSSRYTSVIWDDVEVGKDATMVFVSDKHHVEIYPRDNECYANGCPMSVDLPDDPQEIIPPAQTIEDVTCETIGAVARLKEAKILRTTACFLAGSDDGLPVVGVVPKVTNAVIACGGGCWGILNGPAMGQAAASLVLGEEPPVNVAAFDPSRFACRRGGGGGTGGLPPKLVALLEDNLALQEMVAANPEVLKQLLERFQNDDES